MTDTDMEEEFGEMDLTPDRGGEGNKMNQNKTIEVYSLLHYASSCGDEEIFLKVINECRCLPDILLESSGDKWSNKTCETPLHFAVDSNNIEIVRILIDKIREIVAD